MANKDFFRQAVNVLVVLLMLAVNSLANILPFNGKTTGEISNSFDVYFVPAGYVFSIWGVIYFGLLIFAIYQALPGQRANPRLRRVGYLFAASCLANAAWLVLWHYEQFPLTLVAMLTLLGLLIAIYLRLGIGRSSVSLLEHWLVRLPFRIYLGWITVATIANVTVLLDWWKWDGWGISPVGWAQIMLAVVALLATLMSFTRRDGTYLLVLVWALAGIAVEHAAVARVAHSAWAATGWVTAMTALAAWMSLPARLRSR